MPEAVDRKRLYVPAVAALYEKLAPLSATLIRVSMGAIIFPHGFAKVFLDDAVPTSRNFVKFGWDHALAWSYFIGAFETLAGILLVIGLWTRAVALGLVIEMSVISFAVLWPNWSWGHRGMEYALFMGLISMSILWRGSGPCALDKLMKKEF